MARGVKHIYDDHVAHQIRTMASYQLNQKQISHVVKVPEDTLRKYYHEDWEQGQSIGLMGVASNLLQIASKGKDGAAVTAAIFVMKTRAGWKETFGLEIEDKREAEEAEKVDALAKIDEKIAKYENVTKLQVKGKAKSA